MTTELIVLDVETLGLDLTSALLSIGLYNENHQLHLYFQVDPQLQYGATVLWDTVKWWLEREDALRKEQASAVRLPPPLIFDILVEYFRVFRSDFTVWCNGASFDFAKLAWHAGKCQKTLPWKFYKERCYRTKSAEFEKYEEYLEKVTQGTAHCALDDARRQYEILMLAEKDGYNIRS